MAESTQVERPDILANAIVTGPNVLPLDPSASPAVPAEPVAEGEGEEVAASQVDAPVSSEGEEDAGEDEGEGSDEDEDEEEAPKPQARRKRTIQGRLGDLAQQRNLARQEAEYWKQRALQTASQEQQSREQQQQTQQPGIPRYPNGSPIPPQEDQFPTRQDYQAAQQLYLDAAIQWGISREVAQYRMQQEEQQALRAVRELYTDYDEVVRNTPVRLNNDVSAAVLASRQKHQLIYRLATHPDEAMALENLTGPQAYLAIGRLESLVATGTPPPETGPPTVDTTTVFPVSNAPPPIQPTRGNGVAPTRDYDQMSLQEFFEARNREENRRRR